MSVCISHFTPMCACVCVSYFITDGKNTTLPNFLSVYNHGESDGQRERRCEGDTLMKDKEQKFEDVGAPHTLSPTRF